MRWEKCKTKAGQISVQRNAVTKSAMGCYPCTENWKYAKLLSFVLGFLIAQSVKDLPGIQETKVQPLGRDDPLEREMAARSSILAWETL